jgi:hypothetical protein
MEIEQIALLAFLILIFIAGSFLVLHAACALIRSTVNTRTQDDGSIDGHFSPSRHRRST